jgi:hypothetical protein
MIYVAHRLFALHDRMLAAELARLLEAEQGNLPLFLPYCDTREDSIVVEKKGFYLFERDVERLKRLAAFIAILHGPSYDDGVCMEIGFAYAMQTPVLLFSTDFITYSFASDPRRFVFADPLLDILGATVIHVADPASEDTVATGSHYARFRRRNARSLQAALRQACTSVLRIVHDGQARKALSADAHQRVYIEPSPYRSSDYLEKLRRTLERQGWGVYVAQRLQQGTPAVEEAARTDLEQALHSSLFILDGNGPEVPPGAAFLLGLGLAPNRKTILYYAGSQITHAHGREVNARNLMLLYGCSVLATTLEQVEEAALAWLADDPLES